MSSRSVLYHITRARSGWWFIERNSMLVMAWRDLHVAVDMATTLAEREARRGDAAVKVVWDGGEAC